MSENTSEFVMHYVCTYEEARNLIDTKNNFYVINCGCREQKGTCSRSNHDVCLWFDKSGIVTNSSLKELTKNEALQLFEAATEKHLIARPFRNTEEPGVTDGVCFCCDDCCSYFEGKENSDKGSKIESTNMTDCTLCGECPDYCHFNAREIMKGKMFIDQEKCFGCGLCAVVCPLECVSMENR